MHGQQMREMKPHSFQTARAHLEKQDALQIEILCVTARYPQRQTRRQRLRSQDRLHWQISSLCSHQQLNQAECAITYCSESGVCGESVAVEASQCVTHPVVCHRDVDISIL